MKHTLLRPITLGTLTAESKTFWSAKSRPESGNFTKLDPKEMESILLKRLEQVTYNRHSNVKIQINSDLTFLPFQDGVKSFDFVTFARKFKENRKRFVEVKLFAIAHSSEIQTATSSSKELLIQKEMPIFYKHALRVWTDDEGLEATPIKNNALNFTRERAIAPFQDGWLDVLTKEPITLITPSPVTSFILPLLKDSSLKEVIQLKNLINPEEIYQVRRSNIKDLLEGRPQNLLEARPSSILLKEPTLNSFNLIKASVFYEKGSALDPSLTGTFIDIRSDLYDFKHYRIYIQ